MNFKYEFKALMAATKLARVVAEGDCSIIPLLYAITP